MPSVYEFSGFEWEGKGYAACPSLPRDILFADTHEEDPWLKIALAVNRAKKGDFSQVAALLEIYDDASSFTLQACCCDVLGDAGPDSCFPKIIETIKTDIDPDLLLDCCRALALRGNLSDVPRLLETFKENAHLREMSVLHNYIGLALTKNLGKLDRPEQCSSISNYVSSIMNLYQEVVESLGTDRIITFQGERFGVVRLSEMILEKLQKPFFLSWYRRKFEAATGTDCSNFYVDGTIQPLAAAAILEDFLESPEVEKYEEGARYFFGHRIPD